MSPWIDSHVICQENKRLFINRVCRIYHLEHEQDERTMNDTARSLEAVLSPSEVLAEFTVGLDLAEVPLR